MREVRPLIIFKLHNLMFMSLPDNLFWQTETGEMQKVNALQLSGDDIGAAIYIFPETIVKIVAE